MLRWFFIAFLLIFISLFISRTNAQNAPITWIGQTNPCSATTLNFPVIDTNFNAITSVSLRLDYNPQVLVYDTFLLVNSMLTGLLVNDITVSDSLHKLMIVWSDINPKTIPSGQSLVTLQFSFLGGATNLYWNNVADGGADCEYTDLNGNPLNDLPSENYYKNGYVQGGIIGNAGPISGDTAVCSLSTGVIYQVAPITNATFYNWTIPAGSVITSGAGTNIIHVDFPPGASNGNFQVFGIAGNCQGSPSPYLYVNINPLPDPPVITQQGVCISSNQVSGNQWFDQNGPLSNATSQIYCPSVNGDYYDEVLVNGCMSLPSNTIHYTLAGLDEDEHTEAIITNLPGEHNLMVDICIEGGCQLTVSAINMQGEIQTQQSHALSGNLHQKLKFPTEQLATGMYIIQLNIRAVKSEKIIYKKIII